MRIVTTLIAALLLVVLSFGASAQQVLFEAATPEEVSSLSTEANEILDNMSAYYREGEIRLVRLADPQALATSFERTPEAIRIPLADGAEYAVSESETRTLDNGRQVRDASLVTSDFLENKAADPAGFGDLLLLSDDAGWYGTIHTHDGIFRLRPLPGGLHALARTDWADVKPEEPEDWNPEPENFDPGTEEEPCPPSEPWCDGEEPPTPPPPLPPPDATWVDVLVAFTPSGRNVALTLAPSLAAFVDEMETETNSSFQRSDWYYGTGRTHVNVTGFVIASSNGFGQTNADLHGPNDDDEDGLLAPGGIFQDVRQARESHGADLVVLINNYTGNNAVGQAAGIRVNAANAYAVADAQYAVNVYTFGHEIGHLFGCAHDIHPNPYYEYGHGYVHNSSNPSYRFRTVMAVNQSGVPRKREWSHHHNYFTFPGGPSFVTGTWDENRNHQVVVQRDATVAAFRNGPSDLGKTEEAGLVVGLNAGEESLPPLQVAPNPAMGRATVSFGMKDNEDARVSVYDTYGRQISVLHDGPIEAEVSDISFETSHLAAGVYVVRLETVSRVETARMTVVR